MLLEGNGEITLFLLSFFFNQVTPRSRGPLTKYRLRVKERTVWCVEYHQVQRTEEN